MNLFQLNNKKILERLTRKLNIQEPFEYKQTAQYIVHLEVFNQPLKQ